MIQKNSGLALIWRSGAMACWSDGSQASGLGRRAHGIREKTLRAVPYAACLTPKTAIARYPNAPSRRGQTLGF
jgi:hypothetical protein